MIVRRAIVAAALALALVTGATARAADVEVGIVPPDGWVPVDTRGTDLLAAWKDPARTTLHQNLTLGHDDTDAALGPYATSLARALASSLAGSRPATHRLSICGTQDAYDVVGIGRYRGSRVRIEELVTDIRGKTFIGTYTRPAAARSSGAAEAALRTICPRR